MRRFVDDNERRYIEWWNKATPLERIEIEIKTLEYQIKAKKLESLGGKPPKASFTYSIVHTHKQWHEDQKAQKELIDLEVEMYEKRSATPTDAP